MRVFFFFPAFIIVGAAGTGSRLLFSDQFRYIDVIVRTT